ncbi:hypothetical protein SAY87_000890 [Trapa incisa]|uniref:Uncharacterized protein n=1 Tax=Trapa incisa TaxID=236973 RepID=A0AAN7GSA0_9MYRT|nr:hypothetical protein SAY87_000890 [Trapa incisa]
MSRVHRIVKSESPELRIDQEAYFLINKATVFPSPNRSFLLFPTFGYAGLLVNESLSPTASVVNKERRSDFLSDFVPEKIKAKDALKEITSEET